MSSVKKLRPAAQKPVQQKVSPEEVKQVRDKIVQLVQANPEKAARILAEWMKQPSSRRKAG
jgi:flagellar biosynthesis/type III secretory pathway M-ring protein FliF/YscJ